MPRRASAGTPQSTINKAEGAFFEALFAARCAAVGLWARRNELGFRYRPGGKAQAIRSDLDWTVLRKDGRASWVDTKSFSGSHFTRSMLTEHQIVKSIALASYNVPTGFVVHLRELQRVYFFHVDIIRHASTRARFEPQNGIDLGARNWFDPRLIYDQTVTA